MKDDYTAQGSAQEYLSGGQNDMLCVVLECLCVMLEYIKLYIKLDLRRYWSVF